MKYKYLVVLTIFLIIIGCSNSNTPDKYLSKVVVDRNIYMNDVKIVKAQLYKHLKEHKDFFYSSEYFEHTEILLDSILYSPNQDRIAVFVVTKNPTYRQIMPKDKYAFYYNATLYLGIRSSDSIKLYHSGPNYSNSYNLSILSRYIRRDLNTALNRPKKSKTNRWRRYNLDDVRFWNCEIWDYLILREKKRLEFIEFQKKNPDDVYIPKRK